MYNLFYNLKYRPFSLHFNLEEEAEKLQITPPYQQANKQLHRGLNKNDGIIILTGAKGTGKTTLITHILSQPEQTDNIIAFIKTPPTNGSDFLPAVLNALKITTTDTQPKILFETLHNFMIEQSNIQKKIRLVIDNAETLSQNQLEFLRLLSTLQNNEKGLVQIILVGTNKLNNLISTDKNQDFRQQIVISHCMNPLKAPETQEYIRHQLKLAGWDESNPIIDEDAFNTIHKITKGIPLEINRYSDRLLLLGMLRETQHINNEDATHLTPTTMDKLEKVEAAWQAQDKRKKHTHQKTDIPPICSKQNNNETPQKKEPAIDIEKISLDAQIKNKNFFNKKTAFLMTAFYAVSLFFVFNFYNTADTETSHSPIIASMASSTSSHAKTDTHAAPNHAQANTSHDSSRQSHKQTSNSHTAKHIPKHTPLANASSKHARQTHNTSSSTEFLSIALLSNKSLGARNEQQNHQPTNHSAHDSNQHTAQHTTKVLAKAEPQTITSIINSLSNRSNSTTPEIKPHSHSDEDF